MAPKQATEALELLHRARHLIRHRRTMTEEQALDFLADSESLIACGLGEKTRYD